MATRKRAKPPQELVVGTRVAVRVACDCLDRIDRLLAGKNTRLVSTIEWKDGGPSRAILRTEQSETGRGKPKAMAVVASFCPFCGSEYPPGKKDRPSRVAAE